MNIESIEFEYPGETVIGDYKVTIEYDNFPETPREWSNLGTMVCWHNRYTLGDEHGFETERVFFHVISGLYPDLNTDELTDAQYERCEKVAYEKNIILPLYLYDHSGITMNTTGFSCPWDSGQVGYIYVSVNDAKREYGWKRLTYDRIQTIQRYLIGEVETYDTYLRGEVYCFHIEYDNEEIDSCHGFYDKEHIIDEIKGVIKFHYNENNPQLELAI